MNAGELRQFRNRGQQRCEQSLEVARHLKYALKSKGYRPEFSEFGAYCKAKLGIERNHAYRLVRFAQVAEILAGIKAKPSSEVQVRPLTPLLDDEKRLVQAWRKAVDIARDAGRKVPIGRDVAAAVKAISNP